MGTLRQAIGRVSAFFQKKQHDSSLDAELTAHLDLAIEENLRRGMAPEEARRQALLRFGGVQQAREHQRETRGLPWLDVLGQDLRFTLRTLGRDRAFTMVAVLILALGIGANIVVFSVVNTILLRPLPFPEPQQLVRLTAKAPTCGESCRTYSADGTAEYRERNKSFQDVTGYFAFTGPDNFRLMGKAVPLPVTGLLVMDNFFQTLGVQPSLGRLFRSEEAIPHARPVVLLTHAFWKRQFEGNPNIVGQAVDFDNTQVTVVGVLPETFDFGSVFSPGAKVDVFVPYIMKDFEHDGNDLALIGRLKPGITLGQAQAEADLLFPKLDVDLTHPEYHANYTTTLLTLKDYVSGSLRRSLIVLWCAVGLILLIVCVNLSNLLLARAAARSKEFAMRSALGAGRGRIVRQLLTESLVLSGIGAVLGLGIAFTVVTWLAHQGSIALPLMSSVRIDGTALVWTVLIAFVTAVFFGIAPALRISGGNLQEVLKDSGHGTSAGRKHDRMRSILVVSEVALACVLLVGAGLLLRSFLRVLDVDLGFQPSQAAAISVDYDGRADGAKRNVIWQEVVRRVEAIPGVDTAGITDNLPLSRNRSWGIFPKGKDPDKDYPKDFLQGTFVYIVSPGYLKAIGMRLVRGRDISWSDGPKDQPVVVINQTVANKLWPGEDPVGRMANAGGADARVIGVVADVHESSAESAAGWQMYMPASQQGPEGANLVIRSKLPPQTLAPAVMSTLRSINPGQPATEFKPIQGLVDHAVSPRRFFVMLVGVFAGLGLLLASLGIYGVISYSVTQRTQEIGIRMALGATQGRVQRGIIARTLGLAVTGIAVGTLASLGVSGLIASLLFGTAPTDPVTFVAIVFVLGAVALLAGYIPARRASRIDPMVALRNN